VRPAPFLLVAVLAVPSLGAPAAETAKPAAVHVPFVEGKPFAEVLKRAKAEG
jgi:hypothetical protein